MTRHNFEVNVIVDIDEEEIKRKAIESARKQIVEQILSRTEGPSYNLSRFAAEYMSDCTDKIIEEHQDKIIDMAAQKVANGIQRSPVWNEWLDRVRCGMNDYKPTDKALNELMRLKNKYGSVPAFSDIFKAIDEVVEKVRNEETNHTE